MIGDKSVVVLVVRLVLMRVVLKFLQISGLGICPPGPLVLA